MVRRTAGTAKFDIVLVQANGFMACLIDINGRLGRIRKAKDISSAQLFRGASSALPGHLGFSSLQPGVGRAEE